MAAVLRKVLASALGDLRYEPTQKRVRAMAGGRTFADSRRAVLVWEPQRVVPTYGFPDDDISARLVRAAGPNPVTPGAGDQPMLDPRTGFSAHTCEGEPLSLEVDGIRLAGAGFRPSDPDLHGYVVVDFSAFDEWREEDELIVGHPHNPFSRIDIRRSSSRVQVEVNGAPVADTTSARLLFETGFGPRFYVPRADVRMDLCTPSQTRTTCAYKGHASYWSVDVNGRTYPDLAWTYLEPLPEAHEVAGHICFFNEHVDVILDGVHQPRPVTPWS